MKLTASREDLLAPLQSVIGVVERRQTMPVLANVLLAARDNRLSVTGTDLEVGLVAAARSPHRLPRAPLPGPVPSRSGDWPVRPSARSRGPAWCCGAARHRRASAAVRA